MKHATLAWLAALSLLGSAPLALAQQPAAPAQSAPAQVAPKPPAPQAQQAGPGRPAGARAERRRRSYASCNRASHQRGLQGGKRRRFLIRCRLGYERPRQPPAAQPAPHQPQPPAQPGQRP